MTDTKKRELSPTISERDIRAALSVEGIGSEKIDLVFYEITDSTNTRAKEIAEKRDTGRPMLIIADGQTAGRGRLGRSFLSNRGAGLYMSLLVYPGLSAADGVRITALAAVAVCRALESMTPTSPKIKWVNDVYLGEKKLAGILTEGKVREDGSLDYAIVGIGVNLLTSELGELKEIATDIESECGARIDRAALAAKITREILTGLDGLGSSALSQEYRSRSMLIGRTVRVLRSDTDYAAKVVGITDACELVVEHNGVTERLHTGEVSLKLG